MANEVRLRHATQEYMRGFLDKHLLPALGERLVDTISRADVLQFRSKLSKQPGRSATGALSPKTVNGIMTVLKSIMDEAADRHGFTSPCARVERLKVPRKDIEPFSVEEISKVLTTVRPDYVNYLTTRFYTDTCANSCPPVLPRSTAHATNKLPLSTISSSYRASPACHTANAPRVPIHYIYVRKAGLPQR